eukprot:2066952-Karenia_brevis.AAC.1
MISSTKWWKAESRPCGRKSINQSLLAGMQGRAEGLNEARTIKKARKVFCPNIGFHKIIGSRDLDAGYVFT